MTCLLLEPKPLASGCRYRKWRLASGTDAPEIVVRCEVDAALRTAEGAPVQTVLIKALNEYDLKSQVRLSRFGVSVCMKAVKCNDGVPAHTITNARMVSPHCV